MKCFTPNQLTGLILGVLVGGIIMTLVTIAFMFYWKKRLHKSPSGPSGVKNIENGSTRHEVSQNAKSYSNILFKDDDGKKVFVDIPLNENDEPTKYFTKDSQDLTSAKGVYMRNENLKKQNNAVIKLKRLSKPSISFSSSKKLWGSEDKPKLSSKSFKVPLKSQDFTGLGFNIYGDLKNGIFIKEVLNRGPARESGKIKPGDRIVNLTIAFSNIVFEDALTILSYASPYEISLEILREKSDTSIDSEFESINYEPHNLEQDIKKSITPEAQLILTDPKDVTKNGRSNYKEKMNTPIIVQNSPPPKTVEAIQTESVQAQAQSIENHSHSIVASQPKLYFSSKNLKNWFYSSNNTTDPSIINASGHISSNNEESVINDVIERSNDIISERQPMKQKIPSNTSLDDDIEKVIMTYEKSHKAPPIRSSSFSKHLAFYKQKPKREDLNAKGKTQAIKSNISKSTNKGQNQANMNDSDSDTGSQLKRLSRSLENVYHKYLDMIDHKIGHQDENKIKRSQSLMHHKAMELPSIFKKSRKSNEDVVSRRGTIIEGNCVDLKGGEIIAKQFSKCQPRKSTSNLAPISSTSPHSIFAVETEAYALQSPSVTNSNINTSLPSPSKPKYRVQFEDTHKSQEKDDEFNYDVDKQQNTVESFKKIMERFGEPSSEEEECESIKDEDFNLDDEPNRMMTSNQTADETMSDDKTSMIPKSNSIANNEFKIEKGRVDDESNRMLTPIYEETIFLKDDPPLFKTSDLRGRTSITFPELSNIADQPKIEKTLEEEKNFEQDNLESNTTNVEPEISNAEKLPNDTEPPKTEKRKRNQPLKLHTKPLNNKIVGTAHRIIGTNVEALQEQESKKSYSHYNVNNNNNNKTNIVQDRMDNVFVKNDSNYSSGLNREKNFGNKSHVSNDVKKANYFCDYTGKIFPSGADDNKPAFLIFSPSYTAFYEDDSYKSDDSPIYDNHSLDSLSTVELKDRYKRNSEKFYSFQGTRVVSNQEEHEIFKASAKKSKGYQRHNILKPLNTFFGLSQRYNDESINIKGSRGNSFKNKFKSHSNQIFNDQVTGQELGSNYQMIETKHDCRIADLKPIQYPMDKKQTPWISYENHHQYIPRHHAVTYIATNHKKRLNYSQRPNIYNAAGPSDIRDYSLINTNNYKQNPIYYSPNLSHFDNKQRLSRVYSSCKYNYQGNRNRAHSFKAVFRSSTKSKNYKRNYRELSKPNYGLPQSQRNYLKQTLVPFTKRDILYSN